MKIYEYPPRVITIVSESELRGIIKKVSNEFSNFKPPSLGYSNISDTCY